MPAVGTVTILTVTILTYLLLLRTVSLTVFCGLEFHIAQTAKIHLPLFLFTQYLAVLDTPDCKAKYEKMENEMRGGRRAGQTGIATAPTTEGRRAGHQGKAEGQGITS